MSCNDWAALALWCLGHPDQALERITAAFELAGEAGREYSLANAHMHAARLHQLRGEPEHALDHAEATAVLARERGFAYQDAAGSILLGWARAALGEPEAGIESMREGLAAHRASGAARWIAPTSSPSSQMRVGQPGDRATAFRRSPTP